MKASVICHKCKHKNSVGFKNFKKSLELFRAMR
jgi:hypothetical protein